MEGQLRTQQTFSIRPGVRLCESPDPLSILREEHALQNELCDLLEAIADGLPSRFRATLATVAVSILESGWPAHTRFEDQALFPMLRRRAPEGHAIHAALACLADEHEHDEAALQEVCDGLKSAVHDGQIENPEMLGFLLHGFFESQRRHIAWEDRVVVPVAETILTHDDLSELQGWLMRSGQPRCRRKSIFDIRELGSGLCSRCVGHDPVPNRYSFVTRVRSGYGPCWTSLQTRSV